MLYREVIAVCSEIHTKHINTLCGQNVELCNVKPGGTHSDHWALEVTKDQNLFLPLHFEIITLVHRSLNAILAQPKNCHLQSIRRFS